MLSSYVHKSMGTFYEIYDCGYKIHHVITHFPPIFIYFCFCFYNLRVLEDRVSQISNYLHGLKQQRDLVSSHETTVDISRLHALQEDLHWIVLVTGIYG